MPLLFSLRLARFNDAFGGEAIDFRVLISGFAQGFARMFAQHRRRPRSAVAVREKCSGEPIALVFPARMIKIDTHAACERLRMLERLADRMNGADRNAGRVERFDPLASCARCDDCVHRSGQCGEISHARGVGRKSRISAPFGMAQHIGDPLPVRLIGAADIDPSIACEPEYGAVRMCADPVAPGD